MSVGPRVVFVRFVASDSPKLTPWLGHLQRVLGSRVAHASPGEPLPVTESLLVWQLVSANNRQLARSVEVRDTFEVATADAREVIESSNTLQVELVSEAGRGVYGWYASIDDTPVMTCARWYLTDRDRRHSIELALRAIAIATLRPGARLTDPALMAGDRAYRT